MKQLSIFNFFILTACSNNTNNPDKKLIVQDGSTKDSFYYFLLNKQGDTVLNLTLKSTLFALAITVEQHPKTDTR